MSKFEVGDRVKVVSGGWHFTGMTGSITSTELAPEYYHVSVQDSKYPYLAWAVDVKDLRLAEGDDYKWHIWNGGKCPVDGDTKVEIQMRRQNRYEARENGVYVASQYIWEHHNATYDIIAYRVVEVAPVVKQARIRFNTWFNEITNVWDIVGHHDSDENSFNGILSFTTKDGKPDWSTAVITSK